MTAGARTVVLGLGSNLGDRLATLRRAVRDLDGASGVRVVRVSSLYETAPIGPAQPDFLNAAARVETTLDLHALLDEAHRIEARHGRDRRREERWGPRTLDLDLLWSDGAEVHDARLSVPHPRLRERAFALAPLLEVAPEVGDHLGPARATRGPLRVFAAPGWAAPTPRD